MSVCRRYWVESSRCRHLLESSASQESTKTCQRRQWRVATTTRRFAGREPSGTVELKLDERAYILWLALFSSEEGWHMGREREREPYSQPRVLSLPRRLEVIRLWWTHPSRQWSVPRAALVCCPILYYSSWNASLWFGSQHKDHQNETFLSLSHTTWAYVAAFFVLFLFFFLVLFLPFRQNEYGSTGRSMEKTASSYLYESGRHL